MAIHQLPDYNPHDVVGSGEKVFSSLVEKDKIPVEPAVTITMAMITQIDPDATDESLGKLWRSLHDKYLNPGIFARAEKRPYQ